MDKQLRILFSGTVQGVGFRYTTERLSRRFNVVGFVRNLPDGRVELLAEGPREELSSFLNEIQTSSLRTYIRGMETTWGTFTGTHTSFRIAY